MNYRMIGYLLSTVLLIEAALLSIPMLCAICYGESALPFLYTIGILVAVALPLFLAKPRQTRIFAKDGFVCVAASWLLLSAFGALPFIFSGTIPGYIDAFFETVSGFTTTGATILREVESLPKGILFWRSFTHWVGGMGVLVFMLAILPSSDGRAIHLMRAEVPGPTKGKLVPKLRQTALILYAIYMAFTLLETILLLCTGMPLYDSLVNTFATVGTGGFSVKNGSIGAYANPAAEWIIAAFMLICGTNFNIFYFLLVKQLREIRKNEELRVYLFLTVASVAAIAINTWHMFEGIEPCLRAAFFQATTVMSTTGFATVDFSLFPALSKTVLLVLMITGASAGSTAGGLKISRVLILIKGVWREIKQMLRPRSVNVTRLDGEPLSDETTRSALGYLAIYALILVSSVLLVSVDNFDFESNVTGVLACFNNVGPGLSTAVGPSGTFADFSIFSKLVLSLDMLFGRLEIMPMLILFAPATWKRR